MTTRSTFSWDWRGAEWEGAQISSYLEPAFPEPQPPPPGDKRAAATLGDLTPDKPPRGGSSVPTPRRLHPGGIRGSAGAEAPGRTLGGQQGPAL